MWHIRTNNHEIRKSEGLYFQFFDYCNGQRNIHFSVSSSYCKYLAPLWSFILFKVLKSFCIDAFLPVISLNESVTCFQSWSFIIFTGSDLLGLSNTWSLSMAWTRFSSVRLSASPYTVLIFLPSEKGMREEQLPQWVMIHRI